MQAREFMSQPPITIHHDATAEDAARRMVEHRIGCLPVVDENRALCGIITPSDYATNDVGVPFSIFRAPQLFGQWLPPGGVEEVYRAARDTPVRKIMRAPVITCREDAGLDAVVRLLVDKKVHHVIVVRGKMPVGVVARHDLLRAMARAAAVAR